MGIRIQVTRTGGTFDISTIIGSLLKQGTAVDIVHVNNCAYNKWSVGNGTHGLTYMQYLSCWIPMMDNNFAPAVILMKEY